MEKSLRFRTVVQALAGLIVATLASAWAGCAGPPPSQPAADQKSRHVYKEIKPDEYPIPAAVARALPGLQDDKIRLYREISPTLSLVVYTKNYERTAAIRMCAQAFAALLEHPEFRQDVEFWVIQVQPEVAAKGEDQPQPEIVVWGVRPTEVDEYLKTQDLAGFLRASEYLLVDDVIIPTGEERIKAIPELAKGPSAPTPAPGDSAEKTALEPAPADGATPPTPSPAPSNP